MKLGGHTKIHLELLLLWLVTLLAIRVVVVVQAMGLPDWVLALVPFLFVYVPVWLCRWRGVDSYSYLLALPAFQDRLAWKEGVMTFLKVVAVVLLPWLVGYHLYQHLLFGLSPHWKVPKDAWLLVPYHLFYVAVPEEFFYRGYMQTRLSEVFPKKWKILGVPIGWSLPITAFFFAFGHSIVTVRWWHFAIFFPGLAFGWLREKTDNVVAGALFHAWCNVIVAWLDNFYGLR